MLLLLSLLCFQLLPLLVLYSMELTGDFVPATVTVMSIAVASVVYCTILGVVVLLFMSPSPV